MNDKTDTPRADAMCRIASGKPWLQQFTDALDFSRTLERELSALQQRVGAAEKDAERLEKLAGLIDFDLMYRAGKPWKCAVSKDAFFSDHREFTGLLWTDAVDAALDRAIAEDSKHG